jgi:hypothetical protein
MDADAAPAVSSSADAAASNSSITADDSESLLCREVMQSCEQNQHKPTALEDLNSCAAAQHEQCQTGRDNVAVCTDASNFPVNSETIRSENLHHSVQDNSGGVGEPQTQSNAGAGKLPGSENAPPTKRRTAATEKIGSKDCGRSSAHNVSPSCAENGDPTLIPPVSLEEDAACGRTAIRLRAAAVS